MSASHWHLVRSPAPLDHELPYMKEEAFQHDTLCRAFPDEYQRIVVRILLRAAVDNEGETLAWVGVNFAYIERYASFWWAVELRKSWYWFVRMLWFNRGYVMACIEEAMRSLIAQGMLEELPEWDLVEAPLPSNQTMQVYYPTAALIERLNECAANDHGLQS